MSEEKTDKFDTEELSAASRPEDLFSALEHAQAALENYRKETHTLVARAERAGVGKTVRQLLPVYDAVERALASDSQDQAFKKGLESICASFIQALRMLHIVRIDTMGKSYDPKFHEAVEELVRPGAAPWIILEEVEAGWMWEDGHEVMRPAKVKITKG